MRETRQRLSQRKFFRRSVLALALTQGAGVLAVEAVPPGAPNFDERLAEHERNLERLRRQVAEESAELEALRRAFSPTRLDDLRGGAAAAAESSGTGGATVNKPPAVAPIFEQPGVLTPRGRFVFEPGLQFGYSSSNRVSLVGYTIIPAITIGLIDVREVKRNTFTGTLTGRWGITNRFEIEARFPYVHRSDSVLERPQNTNSNQDQLFSSDGKGIGDIEVTGRYQFNDGGLDRPYYIGTLRLKSRTGKDPFEVVTDTSSGAATAGLQRELPTGSGFYTLQPGVSVLLPSDPAVFFGGVSYQYNFKRDNVIMNTTAGPQLLGEVKPGGVFGFNFGMGLSLNDRASFSIGYDHASVAKTKVNGAFAANSVRTELGTLLVGYSHRIGPKTTVNLSLGVGVTRDTPDLTLTLRVPMSL